MIRHASFQALAVLALAVAMVLTPFGALLVATIGFLTLPASGFFTAARAAILLAAITPVAEIKHRAAGRKATHTLTKDGGTGRGHRFPEEALDNRRRS